MSVVVAASDTRLVDLNRDHHVRMAADVASRTPQRAHTVTQQNVASRNALVAAMLGCAERFAVSVSSGMLLELGAGLGVDRADLETSLRATYHGIEVVPEVAELTGAVCCSIETLPSEWSGKYKWVYSRHVMEHVIDRNVAVANLARVVSDDGIIGAITPHYFPDPEPAHVTQLRISEWMSLYRAHGLITVYAKEETFNCAEAHIVVVPRALIERRLSQGNIPTEESRWLRSLLA